MPITPVDLTDTFDVWRTRTNQIINLAESSNTAVKAAFDKANAANVLAFNTGIGANAYATAAAAGANAYMITIQNGSNTAVGTGANAFASATIAGANAAVGAGANAFTSATISGANTAVGAGANAYALSVATAAAAGANAYMISVQNGSNTAVGTGANAFASATIAGANAAVGAGANTVGSAAFAKANNALANTSGVSFNGNLSFPSGSLNMLDNEVIAPKIKDYSLTRTGPTISSGTLILNYANGNVFEVSLNENITTWTISNWPASGSLGKLTILLTQDGTGDKTVAFPSGWRWASGIVPTMTTTANKTDIIVLLTSDAGTTVYATTGGQNY